MHNQNMEIKSCKQIKSCNSKHANQIMETNQNMQTDQIVQFKTHAIRKKIKSKFTFNKHQIHAMKHRYKIWSSEKKTMHFHRRHAIKRSSLSFFIAATLLWNHSLESSLRTFCPTALMTLSRNLLTRRRTLRLMVAESSEKLKIKMNMQKILKQKNHRSIQTQKIMQISFSSFQIINLKCKSIWTCIYIWNTYQPSKLLQATCCFNCPIFSSLANKRSVSSWNKIKNEPCKTWKKLWTQMQSSQRANNSS